jgi:hypothetical protein
MKDWVDIHALNVIHFTHGATDPVQGFRAHGVRVVNLADGAGTDETFVSCMHIEPGGWIVDPPSGRDCTMLVVHGQVTLEERRPYPLSHFLTSGVGVVLTADVPYSIASQAGAIVMVVEAERLQATQDGKSSPERIMGQTWPGERFDLRPRIWLSVCLRIYYRLKWSPWWRPVRRAARAMRVELSGWAARE